jgi:hypothetical protein
MPTTAPDTCTHTAVDVTNDVKVAACSGLTDQKVCQEDGCNWNLPAAVAPSTAPSTCTHVETEVQNSKRISQCAGLTSEAACA